MRFVKLGLKGQYKECDQCGMVVPWNREKDTCPCCGEHWGQDREYVPTEEELAAWHRLRMRVDGKLAFL